jgi:Calcineurin-like phosphoesterase
MGTPTCISRAELRRGRLEAGPHWIRDRAPSDNAVYDEIKELLKKDVVSFDRSRGADEDLLQLQNAYGSHGVQLVQKIKNAGKIIFHAFGDSGASNVRKYFNELRVADQVTMDCRRADDANRPAFLFHLGDVVYNFGEAQYYYDQFYEPFRNYPAPIFAIPGNHDSFVVPGTPPAQEPLKIFHHNFCADAPVITSEAGSLHRTAMTQPGVYFTLDAPFVRIIGLFSNALEDPGLISSQGGHSAVASVAPDRIFRAACRVAGLSRSSATIAMTT